METSDTAATATVLGWPTDLAWWLVQSAEPAAASLRRLRANSSDSLYSLIYRTNPDHTIVDFVPGLVVVHYAYEDHGTPARADARLVAYVAATSE